MNQLARRTPHFALAMVGVLLSILVVGVSVAGATQEVTEFSGTYLDAAGNTELRAGAHPDAIETTIEIAKTTDFFPNRFVPVEDLRSTLVELPPGFIGNAQALPQCSVAQLSEKSWCPSNTQIGYIDLDVAGFGPPHYTFPVYNMEAPADMPAQFAFNLSGVITYLDTEVRTDGDYGVNVRVNYITESQAPIRTKVTFWGVPADPAHDSKRGACLVEGKPEAGPCDTDAPLRPFLTLPTNCGETYTSTLFADSYKFPGVYDEESFQVVDGGVPAVGTGCEQVPFDPTFAVAPDPAPAGQPTAYTMRLHLPQDTENGDGLATAALKDAVVTLPRGVTLAAGSAGGLASCSPAQLGAPGAGACPEASKVGDVEVLTPVLDKPLEGGVYLATPRNGRLVRIYLVVSGAGVDVKLTGDVDLDPETGQITATFRDNPQLPFSDLILHLKGGPRAPLTMPGSCGAYETQAELTSWSGKTISSESSFSVDSCAPRSFAPAMQAGTHVSAAGAFSPFTFQLGRTDSDLEFGAVKALTLPEGLLASLKGVSYCPDATLAAIPGIEGSGGAEIAAPSCPATSQVGVAAVDAGAGSSPLYVGTGKAYLAGPYKGAPLSLAIVTPAVAGPFDLGNVVIRNALEVSPVTSKITAISDPLPTILHGIPLSLRNIRVDIDRKHFTLNPTSCDAMSVDVTIAAAAGPIATASDRFRATECAALGFKPKLALRLSDAPPRRGGYPKLTATLTMPEGGANIRKAVVTMPETEFLENAHIRTVCTRVQYAADQCPKGSVYGYAKAWTPLLDEPLQGPVYLRSSSNTLPDLVASLDGQIHIDLAGRIDSVDARLRSTFWAVPDAPVSKFQLTMQGGRKGLLVNNTNLCATTPRADARFTGQNGKVVNGSPKVKVTGCGKKQRK